MQNSILIAPVNNLTLSEPFLIYNGVYLLNGLPGNAYEVVTSPRFVAWVGEENLNYILRHNLFYCEGSNEALSARLTVPSIKRVCSIANGTFQQFLAMMGLVKDCSVSSRVCYLINADSFEWDEKGVLYSRSDGSYIPTSFETKDLARVTELFNLATDTKVGEKINYNFSPDDVEIGGISRNPLHMAEFAMERVQRALVFYMEGRKTSFLASRISNMIIALETLYSVDDNTEVSHKVAERTASVVGKNKEEKMKIMKSVKDAYAIRSSFLHGQKILKKKKVPLSYSEFQEASTFIEDMAVRSIIVALENMELYDGSTEKLREHFNDLLFT